MKNAIVGGIAFLALACARQESGADPVMAFDAVDVLPSRVSGPQLAYPPMLGEAGVDGRVEFEFVVTTSGAVDSGSFTVIHSSNNAFEAPTRAAVLAARYTPGQNGGKPVPVRLRAVARFFSVHADGSYDTAGVRTTTPLTAFYDPRKK